MHGWFSCARPWEVQPEAKHIKYLVSSGLGVKARAALASLHDLDRNLPEHLPVTTLKLSAQVDQLHVWLNNETCLYPQLQNKTWWDVFQTKCGECQVLFFFFFNILVWRRGIWISRCALFTNSKSNLQMIIFLKAVCYSKAELPEGSLKQQRGTKGKAFCLICIIDQMLSLV